MPHRDSKRTTIPPRLSRRPTRRGIAAVQELPPEVDGEQTVIDLLPALDFTEPAMSARPTRRDIAPPGNDATPAPSAARNRGPRGEFSIPAARGVPADIVSGSIEPRDGAASASAAPRRRRSTTVPVENVHLAQATKREITVIIKDQALTLERHDALALAQIIVTAFS